jgi:hypothetical protein
LTVGFPQEIIYTGTSDQSGFHLTMVQLMVPSKSLIDDIAITARQYLLSRHPVEPTHTDADSNTDILRLYHLFLPDDYISEEGVRLDFSKKLDLCNIENTVGSSHLHQDNLVCTSSQVLTKHLDDHCRDIWNCVGMIWN